MKKYFNAFGWVMVGVVINAAALALVVNGVIDMPVVSSTTNPNSGFMRLFFKSDGLYYKNSSGTETKVGEGAGGGESWTVNLNDFTRTSGTGTASQESDGSVGYTSGSSAKYSYTAVAFGANKTVEMAVDWSGKPSEYWTFGMGVEASGCSGTGPGRYKLQVYSNADNKTYLWVRREKCDGSGNDGDVYTWTNQFVPTSFKLRVRDDGSNLYFEFCPSGATASSGPWKVLGSEGRTSYITANRAFFHADGGLALKIRKFSVQ